MMNFKGSQFEREIIMWAVRWYVAYPISYRQLEEMMRERGVAVWNVATIGPSATFNASIDRLGAVGSCR